MSQPSDMNTDNITPDAFKPILLKLVKTPEYFTPTDLKAALEHVLSPTGAHPAQVGAFLAALHIERVERRPDSLAAAAEVLRGRALQVAIEGADTDFVVDMVGTGGDGHNTFNVSTTAAIVAAGAGARVVKVSYVLPVPVGVLYILIIDIHLLLSHTARQSSINIFFWLSRSTAIS
jgi:hypothetical protein